jgi:hypothetical protein
VTASFRFAMLVLGAAAALPWPAARAESAISGTAAGQGAVAQAHLDFRITILPSLSVKADSSALRVVASPGALALTSGTRTLWRMPTGRRADAGQLTLQAAPADEGSAATVSSP